MIIESGNDVLETCTEYWNPKIITSYLCFNFYSILERISIEKADLKHLRNIKSNIINSNGRKVFSLQIIKFIIFLFKSTRFRIRMWLKFDGMQNIIY